MWYKPLIDVFKIKDLRKKVLFIFFIFAAFRLLANIPIPGIDAPKLKQFFEQFKMLGLLNVFTGGTLERFSIAMLGLGPYVISSVILQLLTMIFPSLEKMYKEGGEEERRKFEQYGRILTPFLSMLQAFGMLTLFSRHGIITHLSPLSMLSSVISISAGTVLLMWFGELISEKRMGEGISLLIFAGIVADFPRNLLAMISQYNKLLAEGATLSKVLFSYFLFFLIAFLIMIFVILVTEARRIITVAYSKRVRGFRMYGGATTYLPIAINPAGVMPIIFALSILTFPSMVANFFTASPGILGQVSKITVSFFENSLVHGGLYFLLIIIFTYFYTAIVFDPKTISENLQKMGGFIPGIRPGKATADYLSFVLNRTLVFGSIFLGLIALMPSIVQSITKVRAFSFLVGGTSILILVSVVLHTFEQIKAEVEMREYEKF
jgi:preprotein translocase subunit SecY